MPPKRGKKSRTRIRRKVVSKDVAKDMRRLGAHNRKSSGREAMDDNARAYAHALVDPFDAPTDIRIPDVSPTPSSAFESVQPVTLSWYQGSVVTTDWWCGILYLPNMTNQYQLAGAATDFSAITWGAHQDDLCLVAATAAYGRYRTVAGGIRITDYGALLNRGALVYATCQPMLSGVAPTISNLTSSKFTELFSTSSSGVDAIDHRVFSWKPLTLGAFMTEGVGNVPDNTMAAWRAPACTAINAIDNCIGLVFYHSGATAPSDTILARVITRYEALPLPASDYIYETETVIGGEESIAIAMEEFGAATDGALIPTHQDTGMFDNTSWFHRAGHYMRGATNLLEHWRVLRQQISRMGWFGRNAGIAGYLEQRPKDPQVASLQHMLAWITKHPELSSLDGEHPEAENVEHLLLIVLRALQSDKAVDDAKSDCSSDWHKMQSLKLQIT